MQLSNKALESLRTTLQKSYGSDFDASLTDQEVNSIGVLLLTCLVESLKMEVTNPELFTK